MAEHQFELTISGALDDARLDALVDAGCDDATFSTKGDLTFADFTRDAPTMLDAVISAITAIETVPGLEVLHVDPDELVWASEIAERTGRSRQSVDQLIKGQRGPGDFPSPPPTPPATRSGAGRRSRPGSPPTKAASPTPSAPPSSAPSTAPSRPATASAAPTRPRPYAKPSNNCSPPDTTTPTHGPTQTGGSAHAGPQSRSQI